MLFIELLGPHSLVVLLDHPQIVSNISFLVADTDLFTLFNELRIDALRMVEHSNHIGARLEEEEIQQAYFIEDEVMGFM